MYKYTVQYCKYTKNGSLPPKKGYRARKMKHNFLWDVVHNVAFCPIAKVITLSALIKCAESIE
jgi:hypothetical protein